MTHSTRPRPRLRPSLPWVCTLLLGSAPALAPAGQDAPAAAKDQTVEAIDAEFLKGVMDLERARLQRLDALAKSQPEDQAEATYVAFFRDALTVGLYEEAEPVAERVLASGAATPELLYLAHVANVLAEVDRGAFDESLKSLADATSDAQRVEGDKPASAVLPAVVRYKLAETYYQKLVQGGRYDVATQAFTLLREKAKDPAFQEFAENRLGRLAMIGKAAPPIAGKDLDGQAVKLADLKGKVVLVDFWASWCLPCAAQALERGELYEQLADQGFAILGVNVDAMDPSVTDPSSVLPDVRRFLIEHNIRWPNVMSTRGDGPSDIAKAYGVTEVPADFLIGPDGKVVAVDLTGPSLEAAVRKALGR